ncbi:putative nucleotidyltransferase-like protein [Breoghania corrubedonensis]|uniref:Putative nucleotidyltransferase-like protein n=1 Tax=Breoghania corrubedonensis TaxID=665038 RepID=A0A2T5UU88_9HYPH|nr:nucleotidyltransferase family protein [Breoghania corrubedonensis]PTW55070.1 putative nucleotidyltransferase-like protein [Breoghania corrubedonensis]
MPETLPEVSTPLPHKALRTRNWFPSPAWAWPRGTRELLIIAAACPQEARAADALKQWLQLADLNDATFAEHRLLVRAANRFPASRLDIPERARIDGLVRMLWSKSRVSLKAAEPVLQALTNADVKMLVIKGAAFSALDMRSLKGRIAHDIDLVISPQDYPVVLEVLETTGWRPDHVASRLYLEALGPRFHGLNFVKEPNGDIDVHTRIHRTVPHTHPTEAALWQRARPVTFLGAQVHVPCPTDLFTIALAHGTVDAQHHVDWIADCARLIGADSVDWPLFLKTVRDMHMVPHAYLALGYMSQVLDVSVPVDVADVLRHETRTSNPLAYFEALFLFHPRDEHSLLSGLGRRISKRRQARRTRAINNSLPGRLHKRTRKMRRAKAGGSGFATSAPALRQRLPLLPGQSRFRLTVDFGKAGVARRYYVEINTSERHLERLKFRDLFGKGRAVAEVVISLAEGVDATDIWVESHPAGPIPVRAAPETVRAQGAVPVRVAVWPLE